MYSHHMSQVEKPDFLEYALRHIRTLTSNALWVLKKVFGAIHSSFGRLSLLRKRIGVVTVTRFEMGYPCAYPRAARRFGKQQGYYLHLKLEGSGHITGIRRVSKKRFERMRKSARVLLQPPALTPSMPLEVPPEIVDGLTEEALLWFQEEFERLHKKEADTYARMLEWGHKLISHGTFQVSYRLHPFQPDRMIWIRMLRRR